MDPINQMGGSSTRGGSKKGLYIVIGILVLIVVGFLLKGGVTKKVNIGGMEVGVTNKLDGSTTTTTPYGSMTYNANKMPEDWPSDVPTYPSAQIAQSGSYDSQIVGSEGMQIVYLNSSDSAQTVSGFYESKLASLGWTSMYPGIPSTKTLEGTSMGDITTLSMKKDNRMLNVMITNLKTGGSMITMTTGIIPESLQKSLNSIPSSR